MKRRSPLWPHVAFWLSVVLTAVNVLLVIYAPDAGRAADALIGCAGSAFMGFAFFLYTQSEGDE